MENRRISYLMLVGFGGLLLFMTFHLSYSCNEAICASIVSKCMLLEACNCSLSNCTCCKTCSSCLSYLYSECCSCVELCPKYQKSGNLSTQSIIKDLEGALPSLFNALTSGPDDLERWIPYVYPVDHAFFFNPQFDKEMKIHSKNFEQDVAVSKDIVTLNCSVAYLSGCMKWETCEDSCHSMGASRFRWFHDGCCECVGEYCKNYGINESRCLKCSRLKKLAEEDEQIEEEDELDYGEE